MLFKKAHFLSDPNGRIRRRKVGVSDNNLIALSAGPTDHNQTQDELNNRKKTFAFHVNQDPLTVVHAPLFLEIYSARQYV